MQIAGKLLNKSEEIAHRELDSIVRENALRLFAKPRLSDVILKDEALPKSEFDFYRMAHVDFLITDQETKPLLVVEYDGPFHASPLQQRRDAMKDALCAKAGLGILRINANHVTKLYRGMSVLRWIIEVMELEKAFDDAQAAGHVPPDEPFDPAMFMSDGKGRKWPYWLSVLATQSLNTFTQKSEQPSGWAGLYGYDEKSNPRALEYCWFGKNVLWIKTGIKKQNFRFRVHDLLREISICDLEIEHQKYRRGEIQPITGLEFQGIFKDFCIRYDATLRHSCGKLGPDSLECSWSHAHGWKFV